jgi:undecaprenyl-phosphate galactose phosphotransferase/putative colanic acid biosynthesis UDP-glucose lipid carrier transferase
MGKEFPVAEGTPFSGVPAPGHLDLSQDRSSTSRVFGWIHYKAIGHLTGTLDYVLIVTASILAGVGYHSLVLHGDIPNLMPYVAAGNIVAALFVLGGTSRGNYSPSAIVSARRQVRSVTLFWSLAFLSLALFLFLAKSGPDFSRGTIIVFGLLGFVLLLGSHLWISTTLKKALAEGAVAGDRAITIGDRDAVMALSQASILHKAGAREIRRYLLPPFNGSDYRDGLRVVEEAIHFTRSNAVDCVLLALQWNDERRRNLICERLQILPIPVLLLPDQHVQSIFARTPQLAREFTVALQRPPLSSGELALKRALDLMLASVLLVALAPLFLVVALLIKLESQGPVIFSQRRKGFNGREFKIFKFRTMNVLEDGHVIPQTRKNDPRVTRVGRVLRATSIDELPQLLNVIYGHMSLVGPRPHAVAHDDGYVKVIAKYAFRQHVKPGLTGWAQVNGYRGETARLELMEKRVDCDLWYIKNWSFWLDLRILVLTWVELLRGRNAY